MTAPTAPPSAPRSTHERSTDEGVRPDETIDLLVPLDGSAFARAVAPQVRKLFPADRTRLELLHVATPPLRDDELLWSPATLGPGAALYRPGLMGGDPAPHPLEEDEDERLDDYRAALREEMQREVEDFEAHGYRASATVVFGEPEIEIARTAEERGVDAVAMATHARSGVGRLLLGSVGKGVLERVSVPVLLFPATELGDELDGGGSAPDDDGNDDGSGT